MMKRLPQTVRDLRPVEKLVWFYFDRYPGEYTTKQLEDALGVHVGRAVPALVALELLEETETPRGTKAGKYGSIKAGGKAEQVS